eukprot:Rmarinus@m.9754
MTPSKVALSALALSAAFAIAPSISSMIWPESTCTKKGETVEEENLEEKCRRLEQENNSLKVRLSDLEGLLLAISGAKKKVPKPKLEELPIDPLYYSCGMDQHAIQRYSRHLLLRDFGAAGQARLLNSSVLIVGVGGLGCPALLYLAAAGVGRLGLADFDVVDESNLHRQVAHTEGRVGMSKVLSGAASAKLLNESVQCDLISEGITPSNAVEVVSSYDVVIDCTDNPRVRYIVNDACCIAGKPLVSAACVQMEGQLSVYNYPPAPTAMDSSPVGDAPHGCCYRCMFPSAPPAAGVENCSDAGVLGALPGVLGCMQAVEAVKIVAGFPPERTFAGRMLLYDGHGALLRVVRLRNPVKHCLSCGSHPHRTITRQTLLSYDYDAFCRGSMCSARGPSPKESAESVTHISPKAYRDSVVSTGSPHVLLDVRAPVQFEICRLANAVNVPLSQLSKAKAERTRTADKGCVPTEDDAIAKVQKLCQNDGVPLPIYTLCRRGVASKSAAAILADMGFDHVYNIQGGLNAFANEYRDFPMY